MPEHLLSNGNPDVVCGWLCRFVQETRKVDGSRYPPSTIRSLLSAFQRVMEKNKLSYRLFDTSDLRFSDLRKTLDTVCVDLRKNGIGVSRNHAPVFFPEDEQLMWDSGTVGTDSPWKLLRAVFMAVGLHLSLRGGQEHRDLVAEQFRRFPVDGAYSKDSFYEYVERGSKNYQRRFAKIDSNKTLRVYAQPGFSRCPVLIVDLYLSKLPPQPKFFYKQPLLKMPSDVTRPWFQNSVMGVSPLKNMMPNIFKLAGLETR